MTSLQSLQVLVIRKLSVRELSYQWAARQLRCFDNKLKLKRHLAQNISISFQEDLPKLFQMQTQVLTFRFWPVTFILNFVGQSVVLSSKCIKDFELELILLYFGFQLSLGCKMIYFHLCRFVYPFVNSL